MPETTTNQNPVATQGSIEKTLSGDFEFSILNMISESWSRTYGAKLPIHLAFLYYFLVLLALMVVIGIALAALTMVPTGNAEDSTLSVVIQLVMQIGINLIALPMTAGIIMMGIKRSVDAPINANAVFAYFSKTFTLLLTMILVYIMVIIGFFLLIIPGIYLMVAYYMAMPLVVEKNMGPWEAMELSRKAVSKCWFRMVGFFILATLIIIISAIPLGIGLIWTMPMLIIAYGIMYRNLFGVEEATLS